jgi:hypothetical protein
MITSQLVPGTSVPHYDIQVKALRHAATADERDEMVIAIENWDGIVYRVIKSTGFDEFMPTLNAIWDIGLIDVLRDIPDRPDGYDARFAVSQAMIAVRERYRQVNTCEAP